MEDPTPPHVTILEVADLDRTPTDVSTKYVRTFQIVAVDRLAAGVVTIRMPDPDDGVWPLAVPSSLARGNGPSPGDRLIVYDDGYVSWCPRAVYLRDYRRPGAGDIEERCLAEVRKISDRQDLDRRALAVAITNLETGFLCLTKALSPRRNKE